MYAGIAARYYLYSKGAKVETFESKNYFKSTPTYRYYTGWDVGISQVLVISHGPVLQTYSTLIDFGGCGGYIYQITENLGFDIPIVKFIDGKDKD